MDRVVYVLSDKCWCKERLRMLLSHWLTVSTLSTVTRSNITMMSGPKRLPFMVVTLSEPSWKGAFLQLFLCTYRASSLVVWNSSTCHCLLHRWAVPPPPILLQPVMTQFPLTLAWLFSSPWLFFFRSLLATLQTWIRFPVPLSQHHCTAVILSLS